MSVFAPPKPAAQRVAERAEAQNGERARQDAASSAASLQRASADTTTTPWQALANSRAGVQQLRSLAADANAGAHASTLGRQHMQLNTPHHSATAPVQRHFTYGPKKFTSAAQVVKEAETRPEFQRENLGSAAISKMKDKKAKAAALDGRWQALQEMAASDEDYGMISKGNLKEKIASYENQKKTLATGVPSSMAKLSGKATVSVSEMEEADSTEGLPKELKEIVDKLLDSGRAFPRANILKTAKEATGGNGAGFFHELALAAELLDSGDVLIQVGVVSPDDLKLRLGFDPAESKTPVKGFVGGDITVWEPQPASGPAGQSTFIQAKTANKGTVKTNVLEAANQLAGLTASGDPIGKQVQREFTMTGPRYEGAIFVTLIDNVDSGSLAKYAGDALTKHPKYVSRVVYKYALDETFFEVTAANRKGKLLGHNPLAEGRPEFAASEDEYGDDGYDDDYESDDEEPLSDEEIDRRMDLAEYWADF